MQLCFLVKITLWPLKTTEKRFRDAFQVTKISRRKFAISKPEVGSTQKKFSTTKMRRRRKKRRRQACGNHANKTIQASARSGAARKSEIVAGKGKRLLKCNSRLLAKVILVIALQSGLAFAPALALEPQAAWQKGNVIEELSDQIKPADWAKLQSPSRANVAARKMSTLSEQFALQQDRSNELLSQGQSVLVASHHSKAQASGRNLAVRNVRKQRNKRQDQQASGSLALQSVVELQLASATAAAGTLPLGSRVVATQAGQSVELTCNALDTPARQAAANQMSSHVEAAKRRNKNKPFKQLNLLAGPNGTLTFEAEEEDEQDEQSSPSKISGNLSHSSFVGAPAERLLSLAGNSNQFEPMGASTTADSSSLKRHLNFLNVHDYLTALVFWYKDDNPAPIYTLDARPVTAQVLAEFELAGRNQASLRNSRTNSSAASLAADKLNQISQINRRLLATARHYRQTASMEEEDFDDVQANLTRKREEPLVSIKLDWPLIKLRVSQVNVRSAGDFKCRVDFRRARTVRQTVRLLVEAPVRQVQLIKVPPSSRIQQGDNSSDLNTNKSASSSSRTSDEHNGLAKLRLNEGAALTLECRAIGGSPRPKLSWLIGKSSESDGRSNETERELDTADDWRAWGLEGVRLLDDNWPDGAPPPGSNWSLERSQAPRPPTQRLRDVWTSRLTIGRLGRRAHGLQLGCRARQVLQFSHNNNNNNNAASDPSPAATLPNYRPANVAKASESRGPNSIHWRSKRNNELAGGGSQPQTFELTKWLELELNVKPEVVEILWANVSVARAEATSAQQQTAISVGISLDEQDERPGPATFLCRSHNSRPSARIEWFWLAPVKLNADHQGGQSAVAKHQELLPIESQGELVQIKLRASGSESELVFAQGLSARHNQRVLACRATNDELLVEWQDAFLQAQVRLDLRFGPLVKLKVGPSNNTNTLAPKQFRRAALLCEVQSNPTINQLVWLVNGRPLAKVALINKTTAATASDLQAAPFQAAKVELFDEAEIKQFDLDLARGCERNGQTTNFLAQHQISGTLPKRLFAARRGFQLDLSQLACPLARDSLNVLLNFELDFGREQEPRDDKINLINWRASDEEEPESLEFKCLATNGDERVERASKPLVLAHEFDDSKCFRDKRWPQIAAGRSGQASLLDSVQWHQVIERPMANDGGGGLICHQRQAAAEDGAHFLWSFVEAQDLTQVSGSEGELAIERALIRRQVETNSSELHQNELVALIRPHERGLVLCQQFVALRGEWQRAPCLILVRGSSETVQVSQDAARMCTLEPVLEVAATGSELGRNETLGGRELPAGEQDGRGKLVVNLDCGGGALGEALIFAELTVRVPSDKSAARDNGNEPADRGGASSAPQGDAAAVATFERKLFALFGAREKFHHRLELESLVAAAAAARQRRRRLLDIRHDLDYATRDGGGETGASQMGWPNGTAGGRSAERKTSEPGEPFLRIESLGEQVALLNELEFTLRLGDLVEMPASDTRTMLGAQLQVRTLASSPPPPTGQKGGLNQTAGGVAQVSRSTPEEVDPTLNADSNHQVALLAEGNNSFGSDFSPAITAAASQAHRTTSEMRRGGGGGGATDRLLDWGRQHEIGLTLSAIGATLILTALTITLLVLVLKRARNPQASNSSAPSSLSTTNTTATSSSVNHNQEIATNSSPSSSTNTQSNEIFSNQIQLNCENNGRLVHCAQPQFLLASSVSSFSSPPPTLNQALPNHQFNELTDHSEPLSCFHKQQVLDLRHFQTHHQQPMMEFASANKQQLVLDYGGLIVMDESELTINEQDDYQQAAAISEQQAALVNHHEYQQEQRHYLSSTCNHDPLRLNQPTVLGQLTNLTGGSSLQESCATTSAASASETSATPSAIDFLAPPATSGPAYGSTLHLHWLQ